MSNESDLDETTGGGFKRPEAEKNGKVKKFFKKTGSGAKVIGSKVASGAASIGKKAYESYKQYNSPEAKQKRAEEEEERLERQVRMQTQQNKLKKLRQEARPSGGSSFGGFQGLDMGNVFGGGSGPGLGGGMNFGANLNNAFGAISGTPARSTATVMPRRYKTIRTVKKYRVGKRKGKVRYRTKTTKRRVAVRMKAMPQPKAFDPFSQF